MQCDYCYGDHGTWRCPKLAGGSNVLVGQAMTQSHTIKSARIVHYSDNGQTIAYVEWEDGSRTSGDPDSEHMAGLLHRALMLGKVIEKEEW